MHRFIFFSCVSSFDGGKGIGESVEDKNILNVNHPGKTLIMANSLSLQPHKNPFVSVFNFLLIKVSSFSFSLNLLLIEFDIVPDTSKGPSPA